jgi:hypothetical protein
LFSIGICKKNDRFSPFDHGVSIMGLSKFLPPSALAIVLLGLGFVACSEDSKKKSNDAPKPGASTGQTATGTGSGTTTGDGTGAEVPGSGFFLGFDGGKNDYSILLSQGRNYTIKDTSIATIKKETVKLSAETIDTMIADAKKSTPNLDANAENFLRQLLGCEQPAFRIVPLKPGKTTMSGGRQGGNSQDRFGQNSNFNLTVTSYTTAQYDAGKQRYTTDGAGNLKACKSCHETVTEENAPPHELGYVMQLSDAQFIEWVTTGKTGSRTARIKHTWEFASEAQKLGTVAYLRAKASKDVETFTKLVFEERFEQFKADPSRIPAIPGGGRPNGTGTGTGTGTFRCPGTGGARPAN